MHKPVSRKFLAVALLAAIGCSTGGTALAQARMPDHDALKARLWALEQSLYAPGAKRGVAARAARSPYFLAFPAGWAAPDPHLPPEVGKERVALTFVDLAYNGGTAVMMFKAHRTRRYDGTASDDYFEVTDTWSSSNGKWLLLGTRSQPVPPPGQ